MIVKTVVRPETEMKNSGIDWISSIPKDWKIPQVRNFFEINRGRVIAKTEINELYKEGLFPVYSSQTKDNGCMGYIDSYDFEKEGLTWTTDGAYAGTVFYRKGKYNCTNICGILTLKDGFDVSVPFCKYSIGWSAMNCRRADINGYKIMSNEMAAIKFVMPPLSEQQAIADYLDETCSKIDEIIAEAKASIDEYKELKQSVIFEAVTKGLDKNVKMKDSGIEWIGEIPVSWDCEKMRYIVNDIGDIDHYMPESVGHGIAYLMTGDLSDKVSNINFEKCKQVSYEDYKKLSKKIKAEIGDIIFARYASIGIVCYVDVDKNFLVSYSCVVIKPKHDIINSLYVKYYLQSKAFKEEVLRLANSNVQMNVGKESLLQAKITVPSLYEQERIVNFLDKRTAEIDSLIAEKESLINDLEAYKKSLIYEVVTGKRRVV